MRHIFLLSTLLLSCGLHIGSCAENEAADVPVEEPENLTAMNEESSSSSWARDTAFLGSGGETADTHNDKSKGETAFVGSTGETANAQDDNHSKGDTAFIGSTSEIVDVQHEKSKGDPAFVGSMGEAVDAQHNTSKGDPAFTSSITEAADAQHDNSKGDPVDAHQDSSINQVDENHGDAESVQHLVESGKPQRLWGYAPSSSGNTHGAPPNADAPATEDQEDGDHGPENSTATMRTHRPFVAKSPTSVSHPPPEGFAISARVYVDPKDKLAHFDDNADSLFVPYWDCGLTGSTTSPLPIKNAYFRLSLATAPTTWRGNDGKHPALIVALTRFVIELNSGTSHEVQAGEVMLLEDGLLPGHKLKAHGHDKELKVLILTLPQPHLHTGKSHLSLKEAMVRKTHNPCPDPLLVDSDPSSVSSPSSSTLVESTGRWGSRRLRLGVLAALGVSFSTLAADFLGKTAPLWLVVGAGGLCFVVGGTYGFVLAGDASLKALEVFLEQQRLKRGAPRVEDFETPERSGMRDHEHNMRQAED